MNGNKITLKLVVFSIDLNLLKHCFDILSNIFYFVCLFVCLFLWFFVFSVISTVLFLVQTQITLWIRTLKPNNIYLGCCRLCLWNKSSWISWIDRKPQFSKQLLSIQQMCMEYHSSQRVHHRTYISPLSAGTRSLQSLLLLCSRGTCYNHKRCYK